VDWTALSENQDNMVDVEYLPVNFLFRDPSKMKKTHYQALLEHWYERQEDERISTVFAFKGYWDPSTDSVIMVDDEPSTRHKVLGQDMRKHNLSGSKKRPGPPGIRVGDKGWIVNEEDEEGAEDEEVDGHKGDDDDEDDKEGDDNDEGDDGDDNNRRQHGTQSRLPPMNLPFSAKRVVSRAGHIAPTKAKRGPPAAVRKSVLKANAPSEDTTLKSKGAGSSKSTNMSRAIAVKQRPQPRPYRGLLSGSQVSPTSNVPQPATEKEVRKPRKLAQPSPRFEPPTTRSGGKRKADDSGLQATAKPSNKKAKKNAADKGSGRSKAKSTK